MDKNIAWVHDVVGIRNYKDKEVPVTLGLNTNGEEIVRDFSEVSSILVSGLPRSGKTPVALYIIKQLTESFKPNEAEFYLCDIKDKLSDFNRVKLPHVKKVITEEKEIVEFIRNLTIDEVQKRINLISISGHTNIIEYNWENEHNKLPYIYIVLDELIPLVERLDKEMSSVLKNMLNKIVTSYSRLGIRLILMPNMVKSGILRGTTLDLIHCRISVKGDYEHITETLGSKWFGHSLDNIGDMAVRMGNEFIYVRSNLGLDKKVKQKIN